MEYERFKPSSQENTWDVDKDKKDSKSSTKKSKGAKDLAKILAVHDTKDKTVNDTPSAETLLLPDFLRHKPSTEQDVENSDKRAESDISAEKPEYPVDELNEEEQTEAAQAYVEQRLHDLADEELATPNEEEPMSVEHDADVSFLAALRERLTRQSSEQPLDATIQQSYDEVVHTFEAANLAPEAPAPAAMARDEVVRIEQAEQAHEAADDDVAEAPSAPSRTVAASSSSPAGGGERTVPIIEAEQREQEALVSGLLVGGLVGYFVGRRRGRIKTEKRMAKVQQKLETQVKDVQQQIADKENMLRAVVRESSSSPAQVSARNAERQPLRAATIAGVEHAVTERAPITQHDSPERPTAEAARLDREAQLQGTTTELDYQSLLEVSSKIQFGETNLRRVYDARLVDEQGLRRLVHEHAAGHDLRRALAREFLIKELRFERDPFLKSTDDMESTVAGSGKAAQQNSPQAGGASSTQSPANGSAADGRAAKIRRRATQPTTVSPMLTIFLTLLLIALAAYALWLTFTR